ncbi:MAG: GldG family protein [Acidobacteriota bacterium]|nr:GldG family protein [Acidobacteriota bacterium]
MLNRILDILGWFGATLVFTAVLVWLVRPDLEQLRRVLALGGLVSILAYGAAHWREVARSFERRQTRYGALASTGILLVLVIVVALNYVLARQNQRWDLTAAQQYSLSEQTRRVLDSLSAPVRILVFAREPEFPRYQDRLDEYAYQSSQVRVEYIDADRQPMLARQYEIQTYGTIIFDYEGRVERVESDSEQDLTNALIKVVEGAEQTVYFMEGHGEKTHTDSNREGYSTVSAALELDNFSVQSLVLAQQGSIPDDATVVVVAGPQTDLLPGEIDALESYLTGGGKLLLMLDPPTSSDTAGPEGVLELARSWGIEVGINVVVDASGMGQLFGADATMPVAANYPIHPITDRFDLLTAYPLARSVDAATGTSDGRIPQSFIETSAQSWQEADIESLASGRVELEEEAGDRPGPVAIGMAVSVPLTDAAEDGDSNETPEPSQADVGDDAEMADDDTPPEETRLVVIGDSDFPTNAVIGIGGNRDMFLNTISWLAQQENLISIRAREPEDRRLTLTADAQRRVFWLSVLFIPAAALGAGVYTWWQRR